MQEQAPAQPQIKKHCERIHPSRHAASYGQIGACQRCGRLGEVEVYSMFFTPCGDGRTQFCKACVGGHIEGPCFW